MTKQFLQKDAREVFWLSVLLGIPNLIWIYSIIVELNKRISKERRIPSLVFQIPFFYLLTYFPIGFFLLIISSVSFNVILQFHLGAMFICFSLLIMACSSIIRYEKHHNLKSSSGVKLFFGLWFYIFGIWAIQPKLNKYIKTDVL